MSHSNNSDQVITQEYILAMSEEDYMNDVQLKYFLCLLQEQRSETSREIDRVREALSKKESGVQDDADAATSSLGVDFHTRLLGRLYKFLQKIDRAIMRIRDGSYGYCSETGEPIGLARLCLRPTADMPIEQKEHAEAIERQYSDDE